MFHESLGGYRRREKIEMQMDDLSAEDQVSTVTSVEGSDWVPGVEVVTTSPSLLARVNTSWHDWLAM